MLGGSTSLNEPRQKIRRSSIFQNLMNNWVRRMQKLELEQDTTTYDWGMLGPEKMHALELPQRDRARVGVAQGLEPHTSQYISILKYLWLETLLHCLQPSNIGSVNALRISAGKEKARKVGGTRRWRPGPQPARRRRRTRPGRAGAGTPRRRPGTCGTLACVAEPEPAGAFE